MDLDYFKEKFHNKYEIITETGCWLWIGKVNWWGYGMLWSPDKEVRAHRVSYALHYDDFDPSKSILHSCDVPCCVNPRHLRQGTQADNMKDVADRQRSGLIRGKANKSNLTVRDINFIRILYGVTGLYQYEIAKMYDVDQTVISKIINFKIWNK
jgi:hypothetical protein